MRHFSLPASLAAFLFSASSLVVSLSLSACSNDDSHMRTSADILGVWSPGSGEYREFLNNQTVRNLTVETQDDLTIGTWEEEVYYYEPGYEIVLYITAHQEGEVYKVIDLTDKKLVWCPVDKIEVIDRDESIGHIIGNIINKAQEGYPTNPELYETFAKISENDFLSILSGLDLIYPWNPWQY